MTKMADIWREAATDLGLEVITPFRLTMPDGVEFEFDVLLKNFGGERGIVLTDAYKKVMPYFSAIKDSGFGSSVLSPYRNDHVYDRSVVIGVLADWGWTGPDDDRPKWLDNVIVEDEE